MSNALSRLLYSSYPALLFGVTVLAWSSSNQAEVAHPNLPPIGGEYLYWNPSVSNEHSCEQKKKTSFGLKTACADEGTIKSSGQ